ncbi:hypothetical protein [Halarcobacter mediterraneus]|nr:hypothetical protein [Halarcobacter mediterraneus]
MMKEGEIKYLGETKKVLTHNNIYDIFNVESEFVYSKKLQKEVLIIST